MGTQGRRRVGVQLLVRVLLVVLLVEVLISVAILEVDAVGRVEVGRVLLLGRLLLLHAYPPPP